MYMYIGTSSKLQGQRDPIGTTFCCHNGLYLQNI